MYPSLTLLLSVSLANCFNTFATAVISDLLLPTIMAVMPVNAPFSLGRPAASIARWSIVFFTT